MIVLDTNVLSELMKPRPEPTVLSWVDRQPAADLALTAITVGELLYGARRLPDGRRRRDLTAAIEAMIEEDLGHRVLPYDELAAEHFADIAADRESAGRPITSADAQIAATCRSYGATLATRNVGDFAGTGVDVINPWLEG